MSEMALVAAMRPKACGSSTIGMKKSVVAITARSSETCHTAASSAVSVPTRSWGKACAAGWPASSSRSTAGASLQPQPPPWDSCDRRIGSVVMAVPLACMGLGVGVGVARG